MGHILIVTVTASMLLNCNVYLLVC